MYKYLAKNVISGSSTTSISFSDIPQIHKTLILYMTARDNRSSLTTSPLRFTTHGLGNNNQYQSYIQSVDNSISAVTLSAPNNSYGFLTAANGATNGQPGVGIFYFFDYSGTSHKKVWNYGGVGGQSVGTGGVGQLGWWNNTTDPMTSITCATTTGTNFIEGTSFYLYGIS